MKLSFINLLSWRPHSSKTITPHHFTHCLNLCIFWLLSILLFCYCNINNWAPLVCMIFINFRIVRLKLNLFCCCYSCSFFFLNASGLFFSSLNKYIYIYIFYFSIFIVIMVIIDSFIIPGGTVEVSFPFQTLFLVHSKGRCSLFLCCLRRGRRSERVPGGGRILHSIVTSSLHRQCN